MIAIEKGFDSSGVAAISFTIPPQLLGTASDRQAVADEVVGRVRALPGVTGAFEGFPPPATGDSPTMYAQIQVDDRPPVDTDMLLPRLHVESDYFKVLGIPLLSGRMLEPGDRPTDVLISEALARRLWPGGVAAGHRFRGLPGGPWSTVVGVVGHVRLVEDGTTGPNRYYQTYVLREPPLPAFLQRVAPARPAGSSRPRYAQPSYGMLTITVRLDSPAHIERLRQAVRSIEPRYMLDLELIDEQYARQFEDRLLATRIVSAFGALAFVVAAAGIYGLMAFLVATRAREIGIRIAVGASESEINRMVLASSLRLVAAGAVIGISGTVALSRWIESQLFGVRGTDPATLGLVTLLVGVTAIIATWQPARQAARVDPTRLMRN